MLAKDFNWLAFQNLFAEYYFRTLLKQREIGRLVAQTQVGEKENCLIQRCMRTILLISPA